MSDDCCHEESCCNEDSGAKKRTLVSGVLILAALAWKLMWPEAHHGTLWQGHLGVSDGLLVAASFVGGYNFFPTPCARCDGSPSTWTS